MRTRLIACLFLFCLAPALAQQAPANRQSLEARVEALEKENASLRADVDRLQKQLGQTRNGVTASAGLAGQLSYPPTIQPRSLQQQQADANAVIQQNNMQTQMNNLQLQQQLMQDRQREQQLMMPQPYGPVPLPVPLTPNP
jgi:hypothetical protein